MLVAALEITLFVVGLGGIIAGRILRVGVGYIAIRICRTFIGAFKFSVFVRLGRIITIRRKRGDGFTLDCAVGIECCYIGADDIAVGVFFGNSLTYRV